MSGTLPDPASELRIVLVGKTGGGKTSVLNALMGRPGLEKPSASSQTTECSVETMTLYGQNLVVVDTPGVMNTEKTTDEIKKDIVGTMMNAAPGPHVFLLVLKCGRITNTKPYEVIQTIFGEESKRFTLAVLTCMDVKNDDKDDANDKAVKKSPLYDFVVGHHFLHLKDGRLGEQVSDLLKKINKLYEENGRQNYTNDMLKEAQEVIQREKEKGEKVDVINYLVDQVTGYLGGVIGDEEAKKLVKEVDKMLDKVVELSLK